MRVLIINTDYPAFLTEFYRNLGQAGEADYATLMQARNDSLFGVADFYSRGFASHGHTAWEVHANNGLLQCCWMEEHNRRPKKPFSPLSHLAHLIQQVAPTITFEPALVSPIGPPDIDFKDVLLQQVKQLRPDVVLNQAMSEIGGKLLRRIRKHTKLLVGQIASPLPDDEDYSAYDLVISSLPNYVKFFRDNHVQAELNRLAFDPVVLDYIPAMSRDIPVSFVGSLTQKHQSRIKLIESLAQKTDIQVWGDGAARLDPHSPIRQRHQGEAWGREMLQLLARSRITINHHIGIAENYANNMRLYEATGMGALLITDWKNNIAEMFEPGKEVVCYRDAEECADLIAYYLAHESERAEIAAAGQRRTLSEHTYSRRTGELAALFQSRIAQA